MELFITGGARGQHTLLQPLPRAQVMPSRPGTFTRVILNAVELTELTPRVAGAMDKLTGRALVLSMQTCEAPLA